MAVRKRFGVATTATILLLSAGLTAATQRAAAVTPVTWYVEPGAPIPGQDCGKAKPTPPPKGEAAKPPKPPKCKHAAIVLCPDRTDPHPAVGLISSAVGCALAGDTVNVAAATFHDRAVFDKNLTVVGAGTGSTVIDGDNGGVVLTVAPGVSLVLSDLTVTDGTDGIVVNGSLTAQRFVSSSNAGRGLVVDTDGAVALSSGFELHDNGGDGLTVVRASGAQMVTSANRPTVRSDAAIHHNGGNGVSIGVAYTGTPPVISVRLGDADIYSNAGKGIFVRDDGGTASTTVVLLDNDVWFSGAEGLYAGRSVIGQAIDTVATPTFAQNKFHSNMGNQIVFDGGGDSYPSYVFQINSPTNMCDAGANAVYSYSWYGPSTFGIFAQGNSSVQVRHTEFAGGGTGLKDFSAQSGSQISVASNCTAITVSP